MKRAVRMVRGPLQADPNDKSVISRVARQLGVGAESPLRTWVKQADVDDGKRPRLTTAEHEELAALRKEKRELRRAIVNPDHEVKYLRVALDVSRFSQEGCPSIQINFNTITL